MPPARSCALHIPLRRQPITGAARQLLNAFDALPEDDKHQVAVEILCRFAGAVVGDLPESALDEAADELFGVLDQEEADHAPR
jgi:hypothetical protein